MRQEQKREGGKGKTPKEETACELSLGHAAKSCMTVIRYRMGRYRRILWGFYAGAFCAGVFVV